MCRLPSMAVVRFSDEPSACSEDVVGPLALAPADQLTAYDETAFGEADFLADLCHLIPPRPAQSRGDELGADVTLAEACLVHPDPLSSAGVIQDAPTQANSFS